MKKEVIFVTDRCEMTTPLCRKIYYQVIYLDYDKKHSGLALLLYDVNNHYIKNECYLLDIRQVANTGKGYVYMLGKNQLGGIENV